jgi:hypothetical protein
MTCAAACGGTSDEAGMHRGSSSHGPDATTSLRASLVQYREDEVRHTIGIRLLAPDAAVTVEALRLEWPGLEPRPARRLDYPLTPGVDVALNVPYGDARCRPQRPPTETAAAIAVVRVGSSGAREIRIPLDDAGPLLTKIYDGDCTRQRLQEAVDVTFGPTWRQVVVGGRPTLRGWLTVRRGRTTDPIEITSVLSGSVLIDVAPVTVGPRPVARLEPGGREARVPVDVSTSGRCSGHVLGEVKKPYDVRVLIRLGAAEPTVLTVTPSDRGLRDRMHRTVLAGCAVT